MKLEIGNVKNDEYS